MTTHLLPTGDPTAGVPRSDAADGAGPEPTVRAAGTVLWRTGPAGLEVALVHRPRYDDWSFPKGKLDPGESLAACAVRETLEETGITARLGARLGQVHYPIPGARKEVHYWAAEACSGTFAANSETDELRFLAPEAAEALLTHAHDAEVLHRFTEIGTPGSTVLFVRHAKAGDRHAWVGDDDLRPLTTAGQRQAAELTEFLALFGPDRLLTAPPVRCRDTIAPFAEAAGLAVEVEPLLGEHGYWEDPDAGLARLRALADVPGVTVVCSQGGVIPDTVGALAEADGLDDPDIDPVPGDVPSRKGSTWVLTFGADTLRAADYYRTAG